MAAQIEGAKAQLKTAEINLDYTEIRAPIDGKICSTGVTEGNVVSPTSGTLATLVSQDPMYVIFPISQRAALDLRKGGFSAVVLKLRLPDGRVYQHEGRPDYVSPTVAENTDTITLRGVVPNPVFAGMQAGSLARAKRWLGPCACMSSPLCRRNTRRHDLRLLVRSPAPPVVALVGLLGILMREQMVPVGKQMMPGHAVRVGWMKSHCAPHMFGELPKRPTNAQSEVRT